MYNWYGLNQTPRIGAFTNHSRAPYGARPAPFRFHGRRNNFKNPHGRRCVEDAAPNSPGVLFKPVARKQPVKDPAGCTRGPPEDRSANDRAPRDSFSPILVNKYNGHRTVSKGAGRLPFGARADPYLSPDGYRTGSVRFINCPHGRQTATFNQSLCNRNMKPQRFCKQSWSFLAERKMRILLFVKN